MPYIKPNDRTKFASYADAIANSADNAGDLNYALTVILHGYIKKKGLKYANLNEVIGMLECCKMELYRKIAGPYEEQKITENGRVGILLIEASPAINETPKSY